jgi:hypothetical protein
MAAQQPDDDVRRAAAEVQRAGPRLGAGLLGEQAQEQRVGAR